MSRNGFKSTGIKWKHILLRQFCTNLCAELLARLRGFKQAYGRDGESMLGASRGKAGGRFADNVSKQKEFVSVKGEDPEGNYNQLLLQSSQKATVIALIY